MILVATFEATRILTMSGFVFFLAMLCVLLQHVYSASVTSTTPNVLLVLVDDQGPVRRGILCTLLIEICRSTHELNGLHA